MISVRLCLKEKKKTWRNYFVTQLPFSRYVRTLFHFYFFILCYKMNYSLTFPWPYWRCEVLGEMSNRKNCMKEEK